MGLLTENWWLMWEKEVGLVHRDSSVSNVT